MRRVVTLTSDDITPGSVNWDIDWREQASGATTAGHRNILIGSLPRWVGKISGSTQNAEIGRLRAKMLHGRGMTGVYRIRLFDPAVFYAPDILTTFADGATFSDGSSFSEGPFVTNMNAADAGDTELLVATNGHNIKLGQIMSYQDWPFAVTSVFQAGANLQVTLEMPLRVAIPAGAAIDAIGAGLFEMVSPMQGRQGYGVDWVSRPSFDFQEWLR